MTSRKRFAGRTTRSKQDCSDPEAPQSKTAAASGSAELLNIRMAYVTVNSEAGREGRPARADPPWARAAVPDCEGSSVTAYGKGCPSVVDIPWQGG